MSNLFWRVLSIVLMLLLFLLALGLSLSNTSMTELRFYGISDNALVRAPLVVFLIAFFLAGVAAGLLARIPTTLRRRAEIRSLRKQLKAARELKTSAGLASAGVPSRQGPAAATPVIGRPPVPRLKG